jgi:hypothetical protein
MKFLIEANVFPEEEKRLVAALNELKIEYSLWNKEGRPPYLSADNHVFFYGSLHTAIALQRAGARFQLWIGVEFDYSYFGAHLDDMLNTEFYVLPYGMILREHVKWQKEMGEEYSSDNDKMFIRSDSGLKKFQGGIYTHKEFFGEANRVNLFKEDMLIIAEPKDIGDEYRCVIRSEYDDETGLWAHKVVTNCCYTNDVLLLTKDQIKEIEDNLDTSTYHPYPMWILDVVNYGGKFYQLEANSLNTSGLYSCDIKSIVEEILNVEKKEIV